MSPTVQISLTVEQAVALRDALELYARVSMGQLTFLAEKVREGVIPSSAPADAPRKLASPEVCVEVDQLMGQVKQALGYLGNGSMGIGHSHVHVSGHRAWEMYKVIAKALAVHADPHPKFRGAHYDGLMMRYTLDRAPVAVVVPDQESGS